MRSVKTVLIIFALLGILHMTGCSNDDIAGGVWLAYTKKVNGRIDNMNDETLLLCLNKETSFLVTSIGGSSKQYDIDQYSVDGNTLHIEYENNKIDYVIEELEDRKMVLSREGTTFYFIRMSSTEFNTYSWNGKRPYIPSDMIVEG